jgi:hypothetical protein
MNGLINITKAERSWDDLMGALPNGTTKANMAPRLIVPLLTNKTTFSFHYMIPSLDQQEKI